MLTFGAITPHPPIIIPAIGKDDISKCQKTVIAMQELAKRFNLYRIDEIWIVSPHAMTLHNVFGINTCSSLIGNFLPFGYETYSLSLRGAGSDYINYLREWPLKEYDEYALDHGALVPLYYLCSKQHPELVPISFSGLSLEDHYNFGKKLRELINASNKNIAFIASGDLSHGLTREAPAGFAPRGKEFDEYIVKCVQDNRLHDIIKVKNELADEAMECGLRSFSILTGLFDGSNYKSEVLSYEGPFGVGYLVSEFKLHE